ncbi:FAD-binding protein [Rubrimonas cliftonensis]|uniref:FAD-binding protein n=1 Tax=Rubrimonas cliftonensis TaxID=89524 RepID=UPI000B817F28|nr:FAD-binding protein [Rubrimonas cliftonensis]
MAPASEAEAAEAVRDGGPFEIVGGGARLALGRPVEAAPLSTLRLDAVTLYEPQALTLVAGAGARLDAIEAMLAAEGQRLPFEPMDPRPLLGSDGPLTLGGVAATNASGPRRIQAGACRDSLIGVRLVDGRGTVLKNGGRVMKNVTGYDLVKLMCGAYGVLGLLTEVAFKLQPIPETSATLVLRGLDEARAIAALSMALGSPFDVTGAAHAAGETLARIEGFEASVAYRAAELRKALAAFGEAEIVMDDPARWAAVRDATPLAGAQGAVWRLSLRPSDGPKAVAALREAGAAQDALYDWGGGLVWLLTPEDGDAGAAAIRAEVSRRGGHATLFRAGQATRRAVAPFHPEPAPVAALSAGLRAKFDPAGKLNPGRMAP